MAEAAIAASAAICVAVLGALLSFISTRRLQRRQVRLERLNAQLRDFYGPLYAIFQANHIAHLRFVDTLRPGSSTLFAPTSHHSTTKNFACGDSGPRARIATDPPQPMK